MSLIIRRNVRTEEIFPKNSKYEEILQEVENLEIGGAGFEVDSTKLPKTFPTILRMPLREKPYSLRIRKTKKDSWFVEKIQKRAVRKNKAEGLFAGKKKTTKKS